MKKLILSLLLTIIIITYSFNEEDERKINEKWVKIQQRARCYFEKRELIELDKQNLDFLEKVNIPPEVEKFLSELLYEIILYNIPYNKDNSLKAFDILQKKFQDKIHFFDVASEIVFSSSTHNSFVIAKIFKGLTETIEGNYNENLHALSVIYDSIKTTYIAKAKSGTQKYGTNIVITELIAYLREYIRLVNAGKIKETPDKMELIAHIYTDLGLETRISNFFRLKGAKELKKEYFLINRQ